MATEILRPDSDGDETALSQNGASEDWDCVDEASPDEDTTFLSFASSTLTFSSPNLQASALTDETIDSVDVWDRSKVNAGAGSGDNKQAGVRLSGANSMGSTVQLTTSYTDRESAALARPGGGSWEVADLASLQARIGLQESGTSSSRCTQLWVEVNYTAGGGGGGQAPRSLHQYRLRRV
jgi:hypothetical protein